MLCCRLQVCREKISQLSLARLLSCSFLFIFAVCSDVVTLYSHVLLNVATT